MNNIIRFAVVGTGSMARDHIQAIKNNPKAQLKVIHSRNRERGQTLATEFGCRLTDSFTQILNDNTVDAMVIANEPRRHTMAIEGAKSIKHLLIEKPMASSVHEAERILSACRENSVKISVMSQKRFDKTIPEVHRALENGRIGRPLYVDVSMSLHRTQAYYEYGNQWRLEKEGGVVLNNAIHWIDVLLSLFGPIKSVKASLATIAHDIPVEDFAVVLLEFASEIYGIVKASTAFRRDQVDFMAIIGDEDTMYVEGSRIKYKLEKEPTSRYKKILRRLYSETDTKLYPRGTTADQLSDFIDAVLYDREPKVTGENGLDALKISLAAHRSHEEGCCVYINNGNGDVNV